ncbi:MAG: hypothetical protein ABH868_02175 [bacterium]
MYKTFILIILLALTACRKPAPTASDYANIDSAKDPIQVSYSGDPIIREVAKGTFTITPVAMYTLAGVMVSKRNYNSGWESELSPMDFAMAWGDMADSDYDEFMSYRQNGRWYYWNYKAGSPVQNPYISTHTSNNHIIPANDNVMLAAKSVDEGDEIILEGYLVNIKGTYKGQKVWWNTSTSRSDKGNHSCEVFYVTKLKIDSDVFE